MSATSRPTHKGAYTLNLAAAFLFLLFSLWNLIADATLGTHLLLQSSWALPFLWLFLSAWFLGGLVLACFPKRIFIGASILLTLRSSMGWPLSLGMGLEAACHTLNALILALAAAYFVWLLIKAPTFERRPWFRWQHSAIAIVSWALLSVISLLTSILGVAATVDELSNGFVQLTPDGILFTEKVLQKDEHRVHLIGLAHIGEPDFYADLKNSFKQPVEGGRLILTEGVSDESNVLPNAFKTGNTYANFASQLGLEGQQSFESGQTKAKGTTWEELGVTFINADIDISELAQPHLELLIELLGTMESGDLLESFVASSTVKITSKELEEFLLEGLIGKRNDHLMKIFDSAHEEFEEIYIPWGAAHLPDLERRLLSDGFSLISEKERIGIGFNW